MRGKSSIFNVAVFLMVIVLIVLLLKGGGITYRYYMLKKESKKLSGNICGHYSISELSPEYLEYLVSQEGHTDCQSMFDDEEYETLVNTPERYISYGLDIYLENRSSIDLRQLEILSNNEDVYIYKYSFLTCDKPLLIANTRGLSEIQAHLVIKIDNKDSFAISNTLKDLGLYGKGVTPSGYEYIWNTPYKHA